MDPDRPERDHANPDGRYFGPSPSSGATLAAPLQDDMTLPPPLTEQPPESSRQPQPPNSRSRSVTNPVAYVQFRPLNRNESVIGLRRLQNLQTRGALDRSNAETRRRRSTSEPDRPSSARPGDGGVENPKPLSPLLKAAAVPVPSANGRGSRQAIAVVDPHRGGLHCLLGRRRQTVAAENGPPRDDDCYDSRIVDFLDVIDPEVATLSSITNVQNSLFVPSLGRWVNRRPTYDLSRLPPLPGAFPSSIEDLPEEGTQQHDHPSTRRVPSMSSVLTDTQYAILPDDVTLEGWRDEDIKILNDYVRHMLHSRRSKVKQRLKAFRNYTKRPLGFLVTLYASLITLFGLAWVLFLIGWIYVGEKQVYAINVIDYVLVALFNVVGVGFAPWRAVDTVRMAYVAHYHRKTCKLRKKLLLPKLKDRNDLPTAERKANSETSDLEANQQGQQDTYFPVLSGKEQATLLHHQSKLAKSHTFYKPHETETHYAYPNRLLIAVILLLDLHSCLQITLGACTYGIPYEVRPAAVTTTILCCSIATNAAAGILISLGDRRTRKKDVLERLLKQDLTAEAMTKVRKQKEKEEKEVQAEANREEPGLLALGQPLVEKMKKSTNRGYQQGKRKDMEQVGKFSAGIESN